MSQVIESESHQQIHDQAQTQQLEIHQPLSSNHTQPRNRSPLHIKKALVEQIEAFLQKNNKLQNKHQNLQNTVYDLRKLIELTAEQGDEASQTVQSKIQQLREKKKSIQAGIKYSYRNGNHFERCALFWREFL